MSGIIFFDVDGTLVDTVTHKVKDSTLFALEMLRMKGYKLCIATGRSLTSYMTNDLHRHFKFDAYIVNCGQSIYDKDRNIIKESFIPEETVNEVIRISKKLGYTVNLKTNPRMMVGTYNEYVQQFQDYFRNTIGYFGEYNGEECAALIVHGPMGYDYAPYKEIEGLEVKPGLSTFADMTMKGVTKYAAIKDVLDLFGYDEYIAFGDSQNDMDMLEHAKVSICLGNGDDKAKAISDHVAKDLLDDGIYWICKDLGYI